MEKIKIDEEAIRKFVQRTRGTKKYNKLVLFSAKIDGGEYETSLNFEQFEGEICKTYYLGAVAREFYLDEEVLSFGEDGYNYIFFYPREKIDLEILFEMCQRITDEFIDALNKQQELIKQAVKEGVKRYIENEDEYEEETDDFRFLADEISDIWASMGLLTYEDSHISGYGDFKNWLAEELEK